jgi:single-stranded DNA-binding protein
MTEIVVNDLVLVGGRGEGGGEGGGRSRGAASGGSHFDQRSSSGGGGDDNFSQASNSLEITDEDIPF